MSLPVASPERLRLPRLDAPADPLPVGTVYGVLLNYRGGIEALGEAVNAPPYKAAPRAPVLYIKPRNTHQGNPAVVAVPADVPALEIGAALGLVIGRTACRVRSADALAYLAGFTLVMDVSVPHASFYRPAIRFKARDGFCPIGPVVAPVDRVRDPDDIAISVWVDGVLRQQARTADLVRPIGQLMAEVTDFMTLSPGDILMVGVPNGAPLAYAGQRVAVAAEAIGRLEARLTGADGQGRHA